MSRGIGALSRTHTGLGKEIGAFEVEVEVFWCDRLARLAPGKTLTAYLTPAWNLSQARRPAHREIGTYTRAVTLADFRADCFWVLEKGR